MQLTLNTEEREFLLMILEQRDQQMLKEIAHTDRREFKRRLRRDEEVLDSILHRLRETAVEEIPV